MVCRLSLICRRHYSYTDVRETFYFHKFIWSCIWFNGQAIFDLLWQASNGHDERSVRIQDLCDHNIRWLYWLISPFLVPVGTGHFPLCPTVRSGESNAECFTSFLTLKRRYGIYPPMSSRQDYFSQDCFHPRRHFCITFDSMSSI